MAATTAYAPCTKGIVAMPACYTLTAECELAIISIINIPLFLNSLISYLFRSSILKFLKIFYSELFLIC